MTQSIDFTTANDLAKFLSDKLNGNPGPAKILHWISEHQGHRNAKAMKHAHAPANSDEDSTAQGFEGIQASARKDFAQYVQDFVHQFLLDHHSDLLKALGEKLNNPALDLEQALYTEAWEEVDSFTHHDFTNGHEWAFIAGTTPEIRDRLRSEVRDRGFPDRENQVSAYVYEEAVKDTMVQLLRDWSAALGKVNFNPSEEASLSNSVLYNYYLSKATKDSCDAWMID